MTAGVLVSIALAQRGRWALSAVAAGLAVIIRPDALLLAAPLGLLCAKSVGGRVKVPIMIGALIAAPWFAYAWHAYGSPLPQSAAAKIGSESALDYGLSAVRYVTVNVVSPALLVEFPPVLGWLACALTLSLAVVGAITLTARCSVLAALPAYGLLLIAAYTGMRPLPGLEWHLYPVLLIVTICVLTALTIFFAKCFAGRAQQLAQQWAWISAALVIGLYGARTARYAMAQQDAYWYGARDAVYRDLANYLGEHATHADRIASTEVGTIAYYTGLRVFDIAGLVTASGELGAPSRARRAEACEWFVDMPAYDYLYGAKRAVNPYLEFASEPIDPLELHPEGESRFLVVLVNRSLQRE